MGEWVGDFIRESGKLFEETMQGPAEANSQVTTEANPNNASHEKIHSAP